MAFVPFSFHKQVTTPEALASSIDTDQHVLRWFTLLVVQPSVRARADQDTQLKPSYAKVKKIIAGQYILYILFWAVFLTAVYSGQLHLLWCGPLFFIPLFFLHLQLKKNVKTISMHIVLGDFDDTTFRQKTLYQISEFYSRRHQIPSIVDNIFIWDNTTRMIVIATAVLAGQMVPVIIKVYRINFLLTFFAILSGCFLIFMTIHSWIILRHLLKPSPKS